MTITIDFDEVWIMPTKDGFKLVEGEGIGAPFHFRLEIEAEDRETWSIESVYMVDVEMLKESVNGQRTREHLVKLEGPFAAEVEAFFFHSTKFGDRIQDKVNLEIIPPVSEMRWPYETHVGGL